MKKRQIMFCESTLIFMLRLKFLTNYMDKISCKLHKKTSDANLHETLILLHSVFAVSRISIYKILDAFVFKTKRKNLVWVFKY